MWWFLIGQVYLIIIQFVSFDGILIGMKASPAKWFRTILEKL